MITTNFLFLCVGCILCCCFTLPLLLFACASKKKPDTPGAPPTVMGSVGTQQTQETVTVEKTDDIQPAHTAHGEDPKVQKIAQGAEVKQSDPKYATMKGIGSDVWTTEATGADPKTSDKGEEAAAAATEETQPEDKEKVNKPKTK